MTDESSPDQPQDDLGESRAFWDGHAARDPLWAILSDPSKKDAQWDVGGFFQTGLAEVAALVYELDVLRIDIARGTALDFGCGVGRLTQALARHFDRVIGVDVSARMLALAADFNRYPDRVSYQLNDRPNLALLPSGHVDVILSHVVLQHIEPPMALSYLDDFFRVLKPGGVLVFQSPSHRQPAATLAPNPAPKAMADAAYRAALRMTGPATRVAKPDERVTMEVVIENASTLKWHQEDAGLLRAGNHWLDPSGRMLARDDGRAALPPRLGPGESCVIALNVRAPSIAGEFICEIDIAHEGVLWFGDRGSSVARVPVRVAPGEHGVDVEGAFAEPGSSRASASREAEAAPTIDRRSVADLAADDPGPFPMHGVDVQAIRALITRHGATLLHLEPDRSCGDDWVSYRYFVRNRV